MRSSKRIVYGKPDEVYIVPLLVRKNAQLGLVLRKLFGRGGTQVGINTANALVNKETLTFKQVLKIAEYFPRHAGDNIMSIKQLRSNQLTDVNNGTIAWLLWGGNEGRKWAETIKKEGIRKGWI